MPNRFRVTCPTGSELQLPRSQLPRARTAGISHRPGERRHFLVLPHARALPLTVASASREGSHQRPFRFARIYCATPCSAHTNARGVAKEGGNLRRGNLRADAVYREAATRGSGFIPAILCHFRISGVAMIDRACLSSASMPKSPSRRPLFAKAPPRLSHAAHQQRGRLAGCGVVGNRDPGADERPPSLCRAP
jgi:hypothetical protein